MVFQLNQQPEGMTYMCLFHLRICSNGCLSYLDNGMWYLVSGVSLILYLLSVLV